MDQTSTEPDPERFIAYLRGEPETISVVFQHNPKLREITHHSTAHNLRMQHLYGTGVSDERVDEATSEAFTATMLLTTLYNNAERVFMVGTFGEALLAESATAFVPMGRDLIGRVPNAALASLVRAQMDTHLLCSYSNQMREPEAYVRAAAEILIREKQYVDQAVRSIMQHHRFVPKTMH